MGRRQEGRAQLYDYTTDPGELKNLATDPAADKIVAELKAG